MNRNVYFLALTLAGILIVSGLVQAKGYLKVAFLDIGQGDSIYIEAPNGNQMIIDGGPGSKLRNSLEKVIPYGDRSINVLMVTNQDADHYSGFIDLMKDYEIGAVIEPGTNSKTVTYAKLEKTIQEKNIPDLIAFRGMTIDIDKEDGVVFTVLFPDRDVSSWATNDGSIMGILSYGKTKIMFTGDAGKKSEAIVLSENSKEVLKSDILKVGHHGSATSSSGDFVKTVSPLWSVISSGLNNSYGLPKQVTIDTLSKYKTEVLRTDHKGTVIFKSDGNQFVLNN